MPISVFAIVSTVHKYSLSHLAVQGLLPSRTQMHTAIMADTMLHTCVPSVSDRSVDETPVDELPVGGECFHCKVCFQCCNHNLTACTSCGTLTCGDCINFMKTALKNNEDGHRCPTCEDRASEEGGWRMRMVIDRSLIEVPLTESALEHMLQ